MQEAKIVIADTSCFILLQSIGQLDILRLLFGEVFTTDIVEAEYGDKLPDWVVVKLSSNTKSNVIANLGKGEISAIELALDETDALIILDDYHARTFAKSLNLQVKGTLGLVLKAKLDGYIPEVKPLLNAVLATNFRISNEVMELILADAGEL